MIKDPFSVFDNIKGTPKYWQKVKFDMIAKLENIGPFQWFFTLSCGDMRWSSNFTPALEKLNCKIYYDMDTEGREQVTVEVEQDGKKVTMPWKDYLDQYVDIGQHEMIRRDVLLAN